MSYLCAEIKAYDESRKIMTVAFGEQWPLKPSSATFAEVSIDDCDAIGHEVGAGDTGLTPDEASVLKLLLNECGALEDVLAHPKHLVGRVCELDEWVCNYVQQLGAESVFTIDDRAILHTAPERNLISTVALLYTVIPWKADPLLATTLQAIYRAFSSQPV